VTKGRTLARTLGVLLAGAGALALPIGIATSLDPAATGARLEQLVAGAWFAKALLVFHGVWLFAAAIAISFPASGCGVQLAQAALMDADPERREQLMTRWTLAGSLGDLAAPILFAAFALIAWGWREAFVLMGGLLLGYAVVLASRRFPDVVGREADEQGPTLRESVRAALSNRRLLAWLLGVWLCSLLDEIVVVFGSLYLRDLGADQASRGLLLAAGSAGAVLGLVLADRWLARTDPVRLLALACAVCIALYLGWIAIPLAPLGLLLFFGVGLSAAPLYPIAMAQAYRQLPDQAGMVNALGHFFFPLTLAAPFALGFVADAVGLVPTLLLLVVQPAGLLLLALRGPSRPADTPVGAD